VIAAQAGMLHRGCSARRTRVSMAGNEFGLGVFAFACMLLTHPERLSRRHADDRLRRRRVLRARRLHLRPGAPLFDFDIAGIEFSIFYEDRPRNLWGTPRDSCTSLIDLPALFSSVCRLPRLTGRRYSLEMQARDIDVLTFGGMKKCWRASFWALLALAPLTLAAQELTTARGREAGQRLCERDRPERGSSWPA
jgi:hypothetical protein